MLCNKIHKVAMATALWTMALLGASLANAQIKFDGTAAGTVVYSKEGMVADASRRMAATGENAGFYAISATSTLLNARKNLERLAVYRLRPNGLWRQHQQRCMDSSGSFRWPQAVQRPSPFVCQWRLLCDCQIRTPPFRAMACTSTK